MKPATALIISGGGFQGLALVKALRAAAPIRLLVADCHAENITRYFADGYYQAPLLDPPEPFLEFAVSICRQESVNAVFAATEFELTLLDQAREAFAREGATVYVPHARLLNLCRDKLAFYTWLEREGLPCLTHFSMPERTNLPLIGKPRHGWGGRGILVVKDQAALDRLDEDEVLDRVWQPHLSEYDEYSVDFAVNTEGAISPLCFRRRIRTSGGFAVLCEHNAPEDVISIAHETIKRVCQLGALGPMNLQLLSTPDGCWVSDLNPRIGTSMPLSLAAGSNPVTFLLNEPPKSEVPHPSVFSVCRISGRSFRYLEERHVPELKLTGIAGIVFDLDDTLFDQKRWIYDKLQLTWQALSDCLPPRQEFLRLALRILEEGNRAHLFDALCNALGYDDATRVILIETYRASLPMQAPIYPDVLPTLTQLRRLGYRLALLTDNPPASQIAKIEVGGLRELVDHIVLTGELDSPKPSKQGFLACAEALALPPDALIMVGDHPWRDIEGALLAGYRHAFLIERPGGFFNFNYALAQQAGVDLGRSTRILALNEILWHLSETHP